MPFRTDDPLLNLLEKPIQNRLNAAILVKVLPGDTVSQLVAHYYNTSLGTKDLPIGSGAVEAP